MVKKRRVQEKEEKEEEEEEESAGQENNIEKVDMQLGLGIKRQSEAKLVSSDSKATDNVDTNNTKQTTDKDSQYQTSMHNIRQGFTISDTGVRTQTLYLLVTYLHS